MNGRDGLAKPIYFALAGSVMAKDLAFRANDYSIARESCDHVKGLSTPAGRISRPQPLCDVRGVHDRLGNHHPCQGLGLHLDLGLLREQHAIGGHKLLNTKNRVQILLSDSSRHPLDHIDNKERPTYLASAPVAGRRDLRRARNPSMTAMASSSKKSSSQAVQWSRSRLGISASSPSTHGPLTRRIARSPHSGHGSTLAFPFRKAGLSHVSRSFRRDEDIEPVVPFFEGYLALGVHYDAMIGHSGEAVTLHLDIGFLGEDDSPSPYQPLDEYKWVQIRSSALPTFQPSRRSTLYRVSRDREVRS